MLETVLSCRCECGCDQQLRWDDSHYSDVCLAGARRRGWNTFQCPGCAKWCNPGPQVTWWEVSLILTAIARAEIPADSMLGRGIKNLEQRLHWATDSNVQRVLKDENHHVEGQGAGRGGFQITCKFAPRNDRPSK